MLRKVSPSWTYQDKVLKGTASMRGMNNQDVASPVENLRHALDELMVTCLMLENAIESVLCGGQGGTERESEAMAVTRP